MSAAHVIDYRAVCPAGHPDAQWHGVSDDLTSGARTDCSVDCAQCEPPPPLSWVRNDDRRRRA